MENEVAQLKALAKLLLDHSGSGVLVQDLNLLSRLDHARAEVGEPQRILRIIQRLEYLEDERKRGFQPVLAGVGGGCNPAPPTPYPAFGTLTG